jgi:hypothetical protein
MTVLFREVSIRIPEFLPLPGNRASIPLSSMWPAESDFPEEGIERADELQAACGVSADALVGEDLFASCGLERIALKVQLLVSGGDSRISDHFVRIVGQIFRTDKPRIPLRFVFVRETVVSRTGGSRKSSFTVAVS